MQQVRNQESNVQTNYRFMPMQWCPQIKNQDAILCISNIKHSNIVFLVCNDYNWKSQKGWSLLDEWKLNQWEIELGEKQLSLDLFYFGLSSLYKLIWQWLEKLTDDRLIWKCIRKSKKRNQSDSPVRDQIVLRHVSDVILVGYLQSPADHTHYYPMPTKFHPLLVPNYGMHLQQWPSLSQGLAHVLV